jgi:hypothetical protein
MVHFAKVFGIAWVIITATYSCRDYPLGIWDWMAWIITTPDVATSGDVLCLACDSCLFRRCSLGIGASRYSSEELTLPIINAR